MPQMQTKIITDFGTLQHFAEDWDRLWRADQRRTIFGSFSWACASWRAYGSRRSLYTPVVLQDDRVVGIFPLAVSDGTLGFLAAPRSDYNDLLCETAYGSDVLDSALKAILTMPVPWKRCLLTNVPEDSHIAKHLGQIRRGLRSRLHLSIQNVCPNVDLTSNREKILTAILRKKSLRRHEKKLARLGQVRFRHLYDREEIKSHFPAFFRQHMARSTMAGRRSIFCDSETCNFYEALVDEFDPRNELRFSILEADGRPVAYHLGFELDGVFLWYKPTFDVDLWHCSPGEVLIKNLFEYVRQHNVRKFDFTVGEEAFKSRFANQTSRIYTLRVFSPKLQGQLNRFAIRTKDRFKEHPYLFQRVAKSVAFSRNLWKRIKNEIGRHGLLSLYVAVWRKFVFGRDVVVVFSANNSERCAPPPDMELRDGRLSELALLANRYDEFMTPDKLAKATKRLRRGDKAYILDNKGEYLHIAWTRITEDIIASEVGEQCRVDLESPGVFIYDSWTPPQKSENGIYPEVFRMIAGLAGEKEQQCWISAQRNNLALTRGIEKAEFMPKYRMQRTRILRFFTFSHVVAESEMADTDSL